MTLAISLRTLYGRESTAGEFSGLNLNIAVKAVIFYLVVLWANIFDLVTFVWSSALRVTIRNVAKFFLSSGIIETTTNKKGITWSKSQLMKLPTLNYLQYDKDTNVFGGL